MFSHPPCALHPFIAAVALEARARLAIPMMISAQAPGGENTFESETAISDDSVAFSAC
jgi:hypothetical protein